jgi:hypothetical protein
VRFTGAQPPRSAAAAARQQTIQLPVAIDQAKPGKSTCGAVRNRALLAAVLPARDLHGRRSMPAKSKAQQKAAGAALSAKRGDTPKSKLKGPSKSMAESMSEKELEKMASTKRKGKPEHASKK